MATLALISSVALLACDGGAASTNANLMTGGREKQGKVTIRERGCGACHRIDGIPGANGLVGPSLEEFTARAYIAGSLTNTPENVVRWILNPQAIEPNTVMPDLGLTEQEARDVAAYLYSQ